MVYSANATAIVSGKSGELRMGGERKSRKYRGFISYSKKDKAHAARLHKALEVFRVPKGAAGEGVDPKTRRLGRFFRDDDEMGAASDLGAALRLAIEDASSLIVICSPNAASSVWVNQEIAHFKLTGRSDQIFAVMVDGVPHASDALTADLRAKECFPPALRFEVNADGTVSERREEPLAIDLRKEPFARVRARLAAGLTNVSFDDLWQRDRRRANNWATTWAAFSAAFIAAITGGTWWSMTQVTSAQQKADQARTQLDSESRARLDAEVRTLEARESADDLARQNLLDSILQIGHAKLARAESFFGERVSEEYERETDKTIAQEESARWYAAALAYAIALSKGDDAARPLFDRLGYVRAPALEGRSSSHITPDGETLVSDGNVIVSTRDGAKRKTNAGNRFLAFKDNRYFVSTAASADGGLRASLVSVATGRATTIELTGDSRSALKAVFSAGGDLLAVISNTHLTLLRTSDGTQLAHAARPVPASATVDPFESSYAFFTLDHERVVLNDRRDNWIFDVASGEWSAAFQTDTTETIHVLPAWGGRLVKVASARDGAELENAVLWNLNTGSAERTLLHGKCKASASCESSMTDRAISVSSDGRFLLAGTDDGRAVRVYNLTSGTERDVAIPECTVPEDSEDEVECGAAAIIMTPARARAFIYSFDRSARVVDLATASVVSRVEPMGELVAPFMLSADGLKILGIEAMENEAGARLLVWDQTTGKLLSRSGMLELGDETLPQMDDFARTVVSGADVWRSLAPAGETVEAALTRVCRMKGKDGLKLPADEATLFPDASGDDVCLWKRSTLGIVGGSRQR